MPGWRRPAGPSTTPDPETAGSGEPHRPPAAHAQYASGRPASAALHDRRLARWVAPLARARQVCERGHVVRFGVDHQPTLPKPRSRRVMPLVSRTNELAPSAPTSHRPRLAGQSEPSWLIFGNPPERQLDPLIGLLESFGRRSAFDRYPRRKARVVVDRLLELRLEEHIVRLPPGGRRALRLKPQEQLTVGAEPPVVVDRNHLFGQHFGESERLQQPHDLVIDVNGPRETIGLSKALEYRDPVTGSSEHRREPCPTGP